MIDIKALRQHLNISQYALADALNCSQGNISHWELKKRPFPKEGIPALMAAFPDTDVMQFDTLTEDDLEPDYVKKGGLFSKPSHVRKVIFEDDFRKETVEKLLAETKALKEKNEGMMATLNELRKEMEIYRDLLRDKAGGDIV